MPPDRAFVTSLLGFWTQQLCFDESSERKNKPLKLASAESALAKKIIRWATCPLFGYTSGGAESSFVKFKFIHRSARVASLLKERDSPKESITSCWFIAARGELGKRVLYHSQSVHSRGSVLRSRADYLLIESTSAADHALLKSARYLFGAQLAWLAAFQGMELAASASQRMSHNKWHSYCDFSMQVTSICVSR